MRANNEFYIPRPFATLYCLGGPQKKHKAFHKPRYNNQVINKYVTATVEQINGERILEIDTNERKEDKAFFSCVKKET